MSKKQANPFTDFNKAILAKLRSKDKTELTKPIPNPTKDEANTILLQLSNHWTTNKLWRPMPIGSQLPLQNLMYELMPRVRACEWSVGTEAGEKYNAVVDELVTFGREVVDEWYEDTIRNGDSEGQARIEAARYTKTSEYGGYDDEEEGGEGSGGSKVVPSGKVKVVKEVKPKVVKEVKPKIMRETKGKGKAEPKSRGGKKDDVKG